MMQFVIENHCLIIRGVVSMQTLTRQDFQQFVQLCQQPEIQIVDLHDVVRADSVCIALLLTTLRENVSGSLKWINVPESVQTLANLYELPSLDEWKETIGEEDSR